MKFVSMRTRYGGTSAVLCCRKREDATWGLNSWHQEGRPRGRLRRGRDVHAADGLGLLLLLFLLLLELVFLSSYGIAQVSDACIIYLEEEEGRTGGCHLDSAYASRLQTCASSLLFPGRSILQSDPSQEISWPRLPDHDVIGPKQQSSRRWTSRMKNEIVGSSSGIYMSPQRAQQFTPRTPDSSLHFVPSSSLIVPCTLALSTIKMVKNDESVPDPATYQYYWTKESSMTLLEFLSKVCTGPSVRSPRDLTKADALYVCSTSHPWSRMMERNLCVSVPPLMWKQELWC